MTLALGPDLVSRIVRFHQSQASVESTPGRSAFTVRQPIEAPAMLPNALAAGETGAVGKEPV